jgi:hypothetical protein
MKNIFLFMILLLLSFAGAAQSCLSEGITFSTQNQIDSFPINYPNCTVIEGDVTIGNYGGSSNITNINGLHALKAVNGDLKIWYNGSLQDLSGLEKLVSISSNFYLTNNSALPSLVGLSGLSSIGGNFLINNIPRIADLSGLEHLYHVGSYLQIEQNTSLKSLTGIENLHDVGGLGIRGDDSLIDISGLDSLITIGTCLVVNYNNSLREISGLNRLTTIGGYLWITLNPVLTSVTGLKKLQSTGGFLGFQENPQLSKLSGLSKLTTVGGNLFVTGTVSLTSLEDLSNVTSVDGFLSIINNKALTGLTGLENIDPYKLKSLYIVNNNNLSACAAKTICDYLASPSSTVSIHDNAVGCNSRAEVDTACRHLLVENLITIGGLLILPNPASTSITIETPAKCSLSIINLSGQQLLQQTITEPTTTIDVSGLKSGVYFVRLTGDKTVSVGKLLKQ